MYSLIFERVCVTEEELQNNIRLCTLKAEATSDGWMLTDPDYEAFT